MNADIVVADSPDIEERIQEIRVDAVTRRAPADDKRFISPTATPRRYLDELEKNEQDQPVTLARDIEILRESGINNAEVFWKELREAVTGGCKGRSA